MAAIKDTGCLCVLCADGRCAEGDGSARGGLRGHGAAVCHAAQGETDTREWSARLVRFHAHAAQPWLYNTTRYEREMGFKGIRLANYTVTILEGFDPLVGFRRLRLRFRSEPG